MFGLFSQDPEKVVPQETLEGLKHYKYACIDKSILSRLFLSRYWAWSATFAPRWLAPNMITLLGFFLVLLNVPILLYYSPDLLSPGPSWMYWSFAAGIWFYTVMDNVDGKQARRTGTSSPLGELFDHGVDSLNCCLGVLLQAAGVLTGWSWMSMGLLGMTTSVFYFSTWESYHTKILYFGPISGPSEGVVISCTVFAISGWFGPQIWWTPLGTLIPFLQPYLKSLNLENLKLSQLSFTFMACLLFTTQLPSCILHVYKVCKSQKKSFAKAISQLIPYLLMVLFCGLWMASPFSTIFLDHFIPFFLANGIVFGRMATFMILAHVTHSPFPYLYNLLLPLIGGTFFVYLPFIYPDFAPWVKDFEGIYISAYFAYAVVSYLTWARIVINRICTHLRISCFTIPREKWEKIE